MMRLIAWISCVTFALASKICSNGHCKDVACKTFPPTISPKAVALFGQKNASALAFLPTVPKTFNVLVMLADFSSCGGAGPAASEQSLASFLFGRNSTKPTVESQLRFCSHGKASIGQRQVVTVRMKKCKGTWWQFKPPSKPQGNDAGCPSFISEFVSDLAEQAKAQGVDTKKFDNQWVVLDKSQQNGENCFYAGIATLGRDVLDDGSTVGRLVITSITPFLLWTQPWIHEFGHTLGLHHASSVTGVHSSQGKFNEYGDTSCSMGGLGTLQRCFNAAHSTVLGWNTPQTVLELSKVPRRWTSHFLYRGVNALASSVQVYSGSGNTRRNWFISFRTRNGNTRYRDFSTNTRSPFNNDDGVDVNFVPAVHVHNVSSEMIPSGQRTVILGILKRGEKWIEPSSGLNVRYRSFNGVNPTVQICRRQIPTDCQ